MLERSKGDVGDGHSQDGFGRENLYSHGMLWPFTSCKLVIVVSMRLEEHWVVEFSSDNGLPVAPF